MPLLEIGRIHESSIKTLQNPPWLDTALFALLPNNDFMFSAILKTDQTSRRHNEEPEYVLIPM
jgi:hypothetical protein